LHTIFFVLRPFFQAISPTAYRTICNQIVSSATSEQDSLDKACLVAKAFVSTARQNFMSNCDIPDMCSKYFQVHRGPY